MHKKTKADLRGFTMVEVVVVIVIIGILVSIGFVGYGAVQRNAGLASVKSDLANASKVMQLAYAKTKATAYPAVLPGEIKSSPGVQLTLKYSTGGYSGLTSVQNGVLFRDTCQSVINEGYGTGTNNGGQVEQYVTACNVYNNNAIQINGWFANNFSTPVTSSAITSYYAGISADSWRPNMKTVLNTFASTLISRFTSLGGTFPVSSFWDPWATSNNGGIMIQSLPIPNPPSDPQTFCIDASHTKYTDIHYYAANGNAPQSGTCP